MNSNPNPKSSQEHPARTTPAAADEPTDASTSQLSDLAGEDSNSAATWVERVAGRPWRAVHFSVACMIAQCALVIVLGVAYLDNLVVIPVALTAVMTGLAFLFVYWVQHDCLDTVRPPAEVESLPEMVRGLSTSLDVQVRSVYVVDEEQPLAEIRPLVLHRTVDMYLTTGLLNELDLDEISAVIAHELAHVTYHDHHYRTFSVVVEMFSMLTAATILFWTAYTELPVVAVGGGTDVVSVGWTFGVAVIVAGVLWVSGRGVTGAYRRTSEFAADRRAGEVASFSSMYTALRKIDPMHIVGPSPGVIDRLSNDYPLLEERLRHLQLAAVGTASESSDTESVCEEGDV